VHDREHAYFSRPDGVQHGVRKPPSQPTSYAAKESRSCFWMIEDRLYAAPNLVEERSSE
jgi:hypothetical protein